ncbi:MAG: hypothetical protein COA32_10425 [Fluviicola sp.]|nr:MAG: hypothetical protein COA32_10425 [Fluviicola sp.]
MNEFLTSNGLNAAIENLFEDANEKLVLISPYIKLHERYISILKTKLAFPRLEIIIVFGKNEEDYSKSMIEEDFNFFKEFPNIEIRYEKRLHAKYYSNEHVGILTSMNLHKYSQDNNIEAGIKTEPSSAINSIVNSVSGDKSLDAQTSEYFDRVIEQSDVLYRRVPTYKKQYLGLKEKFVSSTVEVDLLSEFFNSKTDSKSSSPKKSKVISKDIKPKMGYCIRTKAEIPFNVKQPFSDSAFRSWSKFSNEEYPEKYCHFSGEESKGQTTFAKPILRKNWKKAMQG